MSARRDWNAIINKLNSTPNGKMRIKMGSSGSAQVTRCRLLEQWNNLSVRTQGSTIYLELAG